jgi:hypothetical protein
MPRRRHWGNYQQPAGGSAAESEGQLQPVTPPVGLQEEAGGQYEEEGGSAAESEGQGQPGPPPGGLQEEAGGEYEEEGGAGEQSEEEGDEGEQSEEEGDEVQALEGEVQDLAAQVDQAFFESGQKDAEMDLMRANHAAEKKNLENEILGLKMHKQTQEQIIETITALVSQRETEVNDLEEEKEKLTETLNALGQDKTQLTNTVQESQKKLEALQNTRDKWTETVKKLTEAVKVLQQEKAELTKTVQDSQQEKAQLTKTVQDSQQEKAQLTKELQNTVDKMTQDAKQHDESNKSLQEQLNKLQEESAKGADASAQEAMNQLQKQVKEKESLCVELHDIMLKQQEVIKSLQEQIADTEKERSKHEGDESNGSYANGRWTYYRVRCEKKKEKDKPHRMPHGKEIQEVLHFVCESLHIKQNTKQWEEIVHFRSLESHNVMPFAQKRDKCVFTLYDYGDIMIGSWPALRGSPSTIFQLYRHSLLCTYYTNSRSQKNADLARRARSVSARERRK